MRAVIFDLDGTLADTSGDLLAAANACFQQMGLGNVLTYLDAGIALRGGRRMLTEGLERLGCFDQSVVDAYYPVLLKTYGDSIAEHTTLYPGAMEAVAQLKATGYAVGICTNKPEALAHRLLQALGVRQEFGALIGADTLPVRKPDALPLMEAARRLNSTRYLLVGDSDTDRNTSAAAGVPSVLVTFGPSGEDMAALNPDALIGSFAELPAVADRLLGRAGA